MSPDDVVNTTAVIGLVVFSSLLFIAFIKWTNKEGGAGSYAAGAFVSLGVISITGLIIAQTMKFGFAAGAGGVVVGIVFIIFFLGFIVRFFG